MRIRAETLSKILDGVLVRGNRDLPVGPFSIDTRTINPKDWFFVFVGEKVDGHDFIPDAIAKGAGGLIVSDMTRVPHEPKDLPVISIENPLNSLRDLAKYIRVSTALFPWYAITGSVGKTTAKGVLAKILECDGAKPLVTPGNWNTEIGVPLTLSAFLKENFDSFILEFAMRAKGEIAYLAEMTQPHIGLITNVAPSHLETLGTMEDIADAKAELLLHLDDRGVAVLNRSDDFYSFFRSKYNRRIITFSHDGTQADVMGTEWDWDNEKNVTFKLAIQGGKPEKIKLNTPSMGMAQSAIAAVGAAVAGKIWDKYIYEGLASYVGEEMRMSIYVKGSGVKVILDCYNANPKSMIDALQVLSQYKKENRTIAVLGGMLELGDDSRMWHRMVADRVDSFDIDIVICAGLEGKLIYNRLAEKKRANIHHFMQNEDINNWLADNAREGDIVLIKGSRGFKLEEVGEGVW